MKKKPVQEEHGRSSKAYNGRAVYYTMLNPEGNLIVCREVLVFTGILNIYDVRLDEREVPWVNAEVPAEFRVRLKGGAERNSVLLGSWMRRALDDDLSRSREPFAYDPMIFVDTRYQRTRESSECGS